ncbi:methylamine utilization protein [Pseudoduganella violacea]|uniref:Plastocyanin n=1 Tax=Pseudoduganella violacea TaxID=1715466 RepID=A0A7W5BBV0_9BURK|nr:methylamine utilization protein [Pseudoduganella violacea]MBB3120011.1 plastocyanin [Pseudoduganella violacea]
MPKPHTLRHAAPVLLCTGLFLAASSAAASGITVQVSDEGNKPLADVIVYAEADGGQAPPKTLKPGEISQKGLKFIPLVTAVQSGSKIFFPNNDKVRHHIYSFSPAHKFDQKLYSGTTAEPQTFEKAGTVVLGCNIHDKMLAYVRVVDTPYFAKTDDSGVVRLDVPAGKYVLKAWHYNAVSAQPAEQAVVVKGGDALLGAVFKLALKPAAADAPASSY